MGLTGVTMTCPAVAWGPLVRHGLASRGRAKGGGAPMDLHQGNTEAAGSHGASLNRT